MRNKVIAGLFAAVILGGIIFWMNRPEIRPAVNVAENNNVTENSVVLPIPDEITENPGSAAPPEKTVREFIVSGTDFNFTPATITVRTGDTVRIKFANSGGFHDFRIEGYNVGTAKLQAGGEEMIEFVAALPGTFEYYCSVGQHRQMGMKGTLTVQ